MAELEHYGVKGMKWGRTKARSSITSSRRDGSKPISGGGGFDPTDINRSHYPLGDVPVYQLPGWISANSKDFIEKMRAKKAGKTPPVTAARETLEKGRAWLAGLLKKK